MTASTADATLPDVRSSAWQAAVDVVRDFPATAGLDWADQNELAQSVVDAAVPGQGELEAQLDELVESWETVLSHKTPPPKYLTDACPRWVLDQLGRTRSAA